MPTARQDRFLKLIVTNPGLLLTVVLCLLLGSLDAVRFRGSGSLAGVEVMLASLGSSLWGCRKGNVYAPHAVVV